MGVGGYDVVALEGLEEGVEGGQGYVGVELEDVVVPGGLLEGGSPRGPFAAAGSLYEGYPGVGWLLVQVAGALWVVAVVDDEYLFCLAVGCCLLC